MRELVIRNSDATSSGPTISIDGDLESLHISIENYEEGGEITRDVLFVGPQFDEAKYVERLKRNRKSDEFFEQEGKVR